MSNIPLKPLQTLADYFTFSDKKSAFTWGFMIFSSIPPITEMLRMELGSRAVHFVIQTISRSTG